MRSSIATAGHCEDRQQQVLNQALRACTVCRLLHGEYSMQDSTIYMNQEEIRWNLDTLRPDSRKSGHNSMSEKRHRLASVRCRPVKPTASNLEAFQTSLIGGVALYSQKEHISTFWRNKQLLFYSMKFEFLMNKNTILRHLLINLSIIYLRVFLRTRKCFYAPFFWLNRSRRESDYAQGKSYIGRK